MSLYRAGLATPTRIGADVPASGGGLGTTTIAIAVGAVLLVVGAMTTSGNRR